MPLTVEDGLEFADEKLKPSFRITNRLCIGLEVDGLAPYQESGDESQGPLEDRNHKFEQESSSFNATVVLTQDHCISFDWNKSA